MSVTYFSRRYLKLKHGNRLPIDSSSTPLLLRPADPLELWPMILTKAVLRLFNNFFNYAPSQLFAALIDMLTGWTYCPPPHPLVDPWTTISAAVSTGAFGVIAWGSLPLSKMDSNFSLFVNSAFAVVAKDGIGDSRRVELAVPVAS
jgi:hypothetical protein